MSDKDLRERVFERAEKLNISLADALADIVILDYAEENLNKPKVKRATVEQIANQPKVSTEHALKGYDYLRVNSKRIKK